MYRGRWVAQTVIHQYLLDNVIWWLIEQFYALCVEIARTVHGRFVCKNPVECVNVVFVWAYGPKQSRSAYLQSKTYVHGINNSVNTGQNQDFVRCMRQTNAKSCCNMYSEIDKRRTQTHKQTRHWLNRSHFFGYEKFRTYVADKDRYWVLKFAFSLWHCVFVPPPDDVIRPESSSFATRQTNGNEEKRANKRQPWARTSTEARRRWWPHEDTTWNVRQAHFSTRFNGFVLPRESAARDANKTSMDFRAEFCFTT